jgi:hypothetical protein
MPPSAFPFPHVAVTVTVAFPFLPSSVAVVVLFPPAVDFCLPMRRSHDGPWRGYHLYVKSWFWFDEVTFIITRTGTGASALR